MSARSIPRNILNWKAQSDRLVFDSTVESSKPFVLANPVANGIELSAGGAHGITSGSQFEIYPPGTNSFEPGHGLCMATITDVKSFTARASLDRSVSIPAAARSVVRKHKYVNKRTPVYFSKLSPASLSSLKSKLESSTGLVDPSSTSGPRFRDVFEIVATPAKARLIVEEMTNDEFNSLPARLNSLSKLSKKGRYLVTLSVDGTVLSAPVAISGANSEKGILDQLVAWEKWYGVYDLHNPNPTTLKFRFTWKHKGVVIPENELEFAAKEEISLVLKNESDRPVYVAILDLASDGSISPVYPTKDEPFIAPNEEISRKLNVELPTGRTHIQDYLKVIYTTRRVDFTALTQGAPKGLERDDSPLGKLIGQRMLLSRATESKQVDVDDWSSEIKVIKIRKP